jgi:hypothetical protein
MVMLPVNTLIYVRMAYGANVPLDWVGLVASLMIAIAAIGSGLCKLTSDILQLLVICRSSPTECLW